MHNSRMNAEGSRMKRNAPARFLARPLSFILHPSSFLQFRCGDLFDDVSLDLIANLHVIEILETDTTLIALAHFGRVLLEAPQRSDVAFPGDYRVANQTSLRGAPDRAVDHHTAGHSTHSGNAK